MNNHPNGNGPRQKIVLTMSPADRKLWLAAHGRGELDGYNLVHDCELHEFGRQMAKAVALDADYKAAGRALGKFAERNPNLQEAALDAVHEANKYHDGWYRAISKLGDVGRLIEKVQSSEPAVRIDLANVVEIIGEAILDISAIEIVRRDRSGKEAT